MQARGFTQSQYNSVEQAFCEGFAEERDVGAAVAAVRGGESVVDLWCGHKDRRRTHEWQEDTLACCFSISKAITSTCFLQAVDAGHIVLDERVATYWPEFAASGKDAVTVRQLMAHRAGLVGFHEPVDQEIYYEWARCTSKLAEESPWWPPGTAHGYHARTFGFLLGEVLRRAAGKTVGQWLREQIAGPLELDVFIGLHESEHERCADMLPARVKPGEEKHWPEGIRRMMADFADTSTATGAAFNNPRMRAGYMNSPRFRSAELPALNGHGTARSIATLFARIPELISPELLNEATATHSEGTDRVLKSRSHFGLGYMLHDAAAPLGGPGSFGHAGAGGSLAFYDPVNDLGFAFVMNQMQEGVVTGGTSALACVEALYRCLE